ncbi:MAG: phage terminase large subunit [Patescibacteria group bacterium]
MAIYNEIINDRITRVAISRTSHKWFFATYFNHYITYKAAKFHHEMFDISENENINQVAMVAFRGSGKSTIFTLSYPLWAITGKQRKKFVVILARTQRQAKQLLNNIKKELESNELLRNDLGPFEDQSDEWGSYALLLPWYNAKIISVSMEQTIRGMRHMQYRPDLIICDDVEDLDSVKTKEGRDKVKKWITGEVIPAGDKNTRIIFIGNLLHEDCLLINIINKIKEKKIDGIYKFIPIVDNNENIMWPDKFKNMDEIKKEKNKLSNKISWLREYMLKIVPEENQVIHREWIKYYDELPTKKNIHYRQTVIGVDLAISQKNSADYTAMVCMQVHGRNENLKIYILPNPINKRMTHHETLETIKKLYATLSTNGHLLSNIYIEDVGYQKSVVQELDRFRVPAEGVSVSGTDKRTRLTTVSHLIQNGAVIFPRKGCELLIDQLVHFGVEKYDDLVDAFTIALNKVIQDDNRGYLASDFLLF